VEKKHAGMRLTRRLSKRARAHWMQWIGVYGKFLTVLTTPPHERLCQ
jgi:hypothetical protein